MFIKACNKGKRCQSFWRLIRTSILPECETKIVFVLVKRVKYLLKECLDSWKGKHAFGCYLLMINHATGVKTLKIHQSQKKFINHYISFWVFVLHKKFLWSVSNCMLKNQKRCSGTNCEFLYACFMGFVIEDEVGLASLQKSFFLEREEACQIWDFYFLHQN